MALHFVILDVILHDGKYFEIALFILGALAIIYLVARSFIKRKRENEGQTLDASTMLPPI
jgi:hypothetical protein